MFQTVSQVKLTEKNKASFFLNLCFGTGSDLIDWLLTNVSIRTRKEAKEFSKELEQEGYLIMVSGKKVKDNENTLIRLAVSFK